MDLHDYLNIRRVLRIMAKQWHCPVWMVKKIIQRNIDLSFEKAMSDPNSIALWNRYFPNGKPTPEQYILLLGHAHETGAEIPFLLEE